MEHNIGDVTDVFATSTSEAARSQDSFDRHADRARSEDLSPGQRVGNAGRNILRSDGISQVDFGIIKNTRLSENVRIQLRADMFNAFNFRNFGIPNGDWNSGANFLNQWATNGGNRRIVLGIRVVF